jgi:hypothetical protein
VSAPASGDRALAHRALVAASLYGLLPRTAHPRVFCSGGSATGNDLVVMVDAPALEPAAFASARDAARDPDGLVAVVVASPSAAGLVQARLDGEAPGGDAFARAAAWARAAAAGPLAPIVSAPRLRELVAHAAAAGLALVEPEVPFVRSPRTAVDRAVIATIALGATARPLLFVRDRQAPKGGLARLRCDRALDGWIGRRGRDAPEPTTLFAAALAALAESPEPLRGKDLLRDARARLGDHAKSRGERVTTSSSDGSALAKELVAAWVDGRLDLYAVDPAALLY